MPPKLLAEWFWTDRWDGSSAALLPLEARGLYREMLTQSWRRDGRLPASPEAIKRAVRCTDAEWERCWPLVKPYWDEKDGWLTNATQLEVLAETRRQMEARSNRASAAAKTRWGCSSNAQALPEHMLKQSLSNALRSPDLDLSPDQDRDQSPKETQTCRQEPTGGSSQERVLPAFVTIWNEVVAGSRLPTVRVWSAARDRVLKARLAEESDLALWRVAMERLRDSPHHRGENDRGWVAGIDFLLQASQAPKWLDAARAPVLVEDPEMTPQLRRLMGGVS